MKLHLLGLIGAIVLLSSCDKDDDTTEPTQGVSNPYNTAFSVNLKTPIDENNYDQISWATIDAKVSLSPGPGYSGHKIEAKDLTQSSFFMSGFNISTGTQTALFPVFTYMGEPQDISGYYSAGIMDITNHDEVNQLISGTFRYEFPRYFHSSMASYTISRTGELIVTFNNVHYD